MADVTNPEIPSDVVGRRVREVREARRLSVKQLAERCGDKAGYELSAQALYNLENGRRDKDERRRRLVTVDELLALGTALNVAPVHLLVPPDVDEDAYQVAPGKVAPARDVRAWIRGRVTLGNGPHKEFRAEAPDDEWVSFDVTTEQGARAAAEWAERSGLGEVTRGGDDDERR